jgi:hypothetical protein
MNVIRFERETTVRTAFSLGREPMWSNGQEFKIADAFYGVWQVNNESKSELQSVVLVADFDNNAALSLSSLLRKTYTVYDENGKLRKVPSCTFRKELRDFIVAECGETVNSDGKTVTEKSVDKVAEAAKKFFDGKTVVVDVDDSSFFGRNKDDGRFYPTTTVIFGLK